MRNKPYVLAATTDDEESLLVTAGGHTSPVKIASILEEKITHRRNSKKSSSSANNKPLTPSPRSPRVLSSNSNRLRKQAESVGLTRLNISGKMRFLKIIYDGVFLMTNFGGEIKADM